MGGGSTVTASYVWCDADMCQARDANNTVARSYYNEGEVVPGAPEQPYYYGLDHLGSVRRVFAGPGNAPAYAYDPYGALLQGPAPITTFGYAGMVYNTDSGLYLTQYRAYDPTAGRWLSRDPLGNASEIDVSLHHDPMVERLFGGHNLYVYVANNPIQRIDPLGLFPRGHHWIPFWVQGQFNFSPEALHYFRNTTSGQLPPGYNLYNTAHRQYNAAVLEHVRQYLSDRGIDPSRMTAKQAEECVRSVRGSEDPRIKPYVRNIIKGMIRFQLLLWGRKDP